MYKDTYITELVGGMIGEICHNYAMENLEDDDFILMQDAKDWNYKEIRVLKNGKRYTLRKSCGEKYETLFYDKFDKMMDKLKKVME